MATLTRQHLLDKYWGCKCVICSGRAVDINHNWYYESDYSKSAKQLEEDIRAEPDRFAAFCKRCHLAYGALVNVKTAATRHEILRRASNDAQMRSIHGEFPVKRRPPQKYDKCLVCNNEFLRQGPKKTCSAECRDEYRKNARKYGTRFASCVVCGKEFKTSSGVKKTCSLKCAKISGRPPNLGEVEKKCVTCGKVFKTSSGVKKTCSLNCANERKNAARRYGAAKKNCIVCGKHSRPAVA